MSAGLRNLRVGKFTDESVDVSEYASLLSPFQIEKLSYLFKCLDTTGDGYVNVSNLSRNFLSISFFYRKMICSPSMNFSATLLDGRRMIQGT